MNDDLEEQIQNSTTPHIDTDSDMDPGDGGDVRAPKQTTPSDSDAPDLAEEKVFDVTSDFNISEEENQSTARQSVGNIYAMPLKKRPTPAAPAPSIPSPAASTSATPPPFVPTLKMPTPKITPPPPPVPRSIPSPAPKLVVRAPIMPPIQAPVTETLKREAEPATETRPPQGPQGLRTYETDVLEVMSHTHVSTTSMALAESKKREGMQVMKTAAEPKESKHIIIKILIIIGIVVLFGGGTFGAYYLYSISPLAPAPSTPAIQQAQVSTSLIPADTTVSIPIDDLSSDDVRTKILDETQKPQDPRTIKEIIPTKMDAAGVAMRIAGPDMIAAADIPAPDILSRSLTSPWMLGVYSDSKSNKSIFIVATTNFFQNAFAGMLQWESAMPENFRSFIIPNSTFATRTTGAQSPATLTQNDLIQLGQSLPTLATSTAHTQPTSTKKILPPKPTSTIGEITGGGGTGPTHTATSSTATTTPDPRSYVTASTSLTSESPVYISGYVPIQGTFIDRIIQNKDVREFKDTAGNVLFLYSFVDNSHIIFASSEGALTAALLRVEKQPFVR